MKTSTLPSLRVAPELREAAESVLREGETLSSFIETSLRTQIDQRRLQDEFVARGIDALARAERTGRTVPAADVVAGLKATLAKAQTKSR